MKSLTAGTPKMGRSSAKFAPVIWNYQRFAPRQAVHGSCYDSYQNPKRGKQLDLKRFYCGFENLLFFLI